VITASSGVEMEHMYHIMQSYPKRSWRWKSCHCCSCKRQCWNGTHVPQNPIISQKKLEMEILPLLFMQAAVVKWNTCTIKWKTHPQRSWRWKSCHCCWCKQQCWNGTHVPQNAKHTQIEAKDGNSVMVVHELSKYQRYKGKMHDHKDASLSIDSEFTSPNKLPVIYQILFQCMVVSTSWSKPRYAS